jgi:hypothetical protein
MYPPHVQQRDAARQIYQPRPKAENRQMEFLQSTRGLERDISAHNTRRGTEYTGTQTRGGCPGKTKDRRRTTVDMINALLCQHVAWYVAAGKQKARVQYCV